MPVFVSVVGPTKSGKTTLIEKMIPELKKRGYRVGTVKHTPHGYDLDKTGKDSHRHRRAGAAVAIAAGNEEMVITRDLPPASATETLTFLTPWFGEVDLVITEGYKQADKPKIEIVVPDRAPRFLEDPALLAVVGEQEDLPAGLTAFGPDDIVPLVDLIAARCLLPQK